ncbi:hypothetical protein OG874_17270 [Nocardia sp. NBC_00565]|uniref:hypothetical protein n=1 Tax=Nocardia sp. NBC_00565 TaxID=2975993 RepID=UPI002E8208DE|nr:hypothetical protein [Nocardia sp. NBC_00565]WUC06757.1 hypothetical protein OG874_17270 [Nocardia sp. NBC_00565]
MDSSQSTTARIDAGSDGSILDEGIVAAITEEGLPHDHTHVAGRAIATMCTALPQWFRLDGPTSPEQIAAQYADFALGLLGLRPALTHAR